MSRKKPTNQHKKEGTFQPCRHAGDNVAVSAVETPIPLTEEEQQYFDRISGWLLKQNLCTELDGIAIAAMAQALVDYVHHRESARGGAAIDVSEKGVRFLGADFNAMRSSQKMLNHYLSKFGMTPVDRTGLECGEDSGEDAFDALLKRSMN